VYAESDSRVAPCERRRRAKNPRDAQRQNAEAMTGVQQRLTVQTGRAHVTLTVSMK
jgi:hypothetical protein